MKSILRFWWLILAWLLAMFGSEFWELNAGEWFASIAIVVGAVCTGIYKYRDYRRKTLLRIKHVRNSWCDAPEHQDEKYWLEVELEYLPRKQYQVSSPKLLIAGRCCHYYKNEAFIPKKNLRCAFMFPVPKDIIENINYAHITVDFAGEQFKTKMFKVENYPVSS